MEVVSVIIGEVDSIATDNKNWKWVQCWY